MKTAVRVVASTDQYRSEDILRDGGSIVVRAIRPDDKARLADHFARLSLRSVYLRFFHAKRRLTDEEVAHFTELDFVHRVGLAATLVEGGAERIVGVGRFDVDAEDSTRAEVAFAVTDDHQGRGIGTLLLDHLVPIARAAGITEFHADVMGDNKRMLQVFGNSGCVVRRSIDGGIFTLTFPTAATPAYAEASLARVEHASAESMRAILEPRAVAVVGASRDPASIGGVLLHNVRTSFQGPVYPVHPSAAELQGLRAFPTVRAIGAPVDLAVIAVPAAAVEDVVADCAAAGVRGLVVISSGFGEVAASGREIERRLRERVRASGMRLVGPNCMGVINTDSARGVNASFAPGVPTPGAIAMLSQSGALGLAILDHVRTRGLGLSSFVSVGNKADVSSNDLVAYWKDDPRTEVIVLYLESFGNPRKFARIAPDVARRKPIIAVKSGRSAAGVRAASSHSASLASLDVAVDALFEQCGIVRADTLEELFDVAALLSTQPVPMGERVVVVTNAGGPGILLADACEAHGLTLSELTPETRAELRGFLSPAAGVANPVDMTAAATGEDYVRAITAVGQDPNADAVVVIHIPVLGSTGETTAAIARGAATVPAAKPVLAVLMSSEHGGGALAAGTRGTLPVYRFPENAALALAAATRYGAWRRRPNGSPLVLGAFARQAVRAVVDRVRVTAGGGPRWLAPADVRAVLSAAGIDVVPEARVAPAEAGAVAARLGYPVVAKAIAPGVLHKSDVGGVRLGLRSEADVVAAVDAIAAAMRAIDAPLEGILLQQEVGEGVEALVGVTTDPTFGPVVVCGLGGVLVEVLRDVSFRLTPVTDLDAEAMLAALKGSRLLDGYRGSPAADRGALVDVIVRISALVEIVPELRELDLNPVKVLAPGKGAVVVDARMRIG
jgi:acetyl coenzyme A synthetase (ADP forming)-like protein